MRCFNWRKYKRKGLKKIKSKDEKVLKKNIQKLKMHELRVKSIKDISREILIEE